MTGLYPYQPAFGAEAAKASTLPTTPPVFKPPVEPVTISMVAGSTWDALTIDQKLAALAGLGAAVGAAIGGLLPFNRRSRNAAIGAAAGLAAGVLYVPVGFMIQDVR